MRYFSFVSFCFLFFSLHGINLLPFTKDSLCWVPADIVVLSMSVFKCIFDGYMYAYVLMCVDVRMGRGRAEYFKLEVHKTHEYDFGVLRNLRTLLGRWICLWPCPIYLRPGDSKAGYYYQTNRYCEHVHTF